MKCRSYEDFRKILESSIDKISRRFSSLKLVKVRSDLYTITVQQVKYDFEGNRSKSYSKHIIEFIYRRDRGIACMRYIVPGELKVDDRTCVIDEINADTVLYAYVRIANKVADINARNLLWTIPHRTIYTLNKMMVEECEDCSEMLIEDKELVHKYKRLEIDVFSEEDEDE